MATATAPVDDTLGEATEERRRLLDQAALLEGEARAFLGRLDIPVGGDVIDIGCGPIGVLPLLSERVGPHGQVTGLDHHGDMLDHAARVCASLGNVRFVLADATDTQLARGMFDLAHIRLLLGNVADPAGVLHEAAAIVRPHGTVAVQEVDWLSWECSPAHPAWVALRTILLRLWHARGLDPYIGRRLPSLLRSAGLHDVEARASAEIDSAGQHSQRLILTFAERFRSRIVEAGIATAAKLDSLCGQLARHLTRPDTVVVRAMTVQASGRVGRRPR